MHAPISATSKWACAPWMLGLRHLPDSARLHYERGLFLAQLDRLEEARPELDRAAQLAPDTYIARWRSCSGTCTTAKFQRATIGACGQIRGWTPGLPDAILLGTVLMHCRGGARRPRICAGPGRRSKNRPEPIPSIPLRRSRWAGSTSSKSASRGRRAPGNRKDGWSREIPRSIPILPVLINTWAIRQKAREMQDNLPEASGENGFLRPEPAL